MRKRENVREGISEALLHAGCNSAKVSVDLALYFDIRRHFDEENNLVRLTGGLPKIKLTTASLAIFPSVKELI